MKWLTRAGRVGSIELFGGCQHLWEWEGLELRRFRIPEKVLPFLAGRCGTGFLCDESKCGLELDRAPRPRRPLTSISAGFSGRLTSAAVGLWG